MEESTGNESTANQATETVSAPATTPASTKKSWEHPWTVAEIRKQAGQWSLAADVGLLRHMKEFASLLTTQAHEVSVEVSQLVHDTKLTDAKIETVTDYFLTLSDSQFIENRVYDEDDTLDKKEENEKKVESKKVKTREEREAELLPRLKESVQFGLKVIEDAYDVLDIKAIDSDSEDEDEDNTLLSKEIILEPKDPYVTRPLPYLIGSRNFINEDDVGVGDLPSSDEAESEAGSMSESDEEIEKPATVSDVSTSDYDSDLSEESDMEQTPVTGKNALTMTSSDDDLSSSEDDDELSEEEIKHPAKVEAKTEVHAHPSTKKKRGKSKRASENNDIFGEEEAEDDLFAANDGLFGKGGGLFSKPKGGLFDGVEDFDDDESLSGSSSQEEEKEPVENIKPKAKSKPAAPQGGISLFGGAISKGFFKGQEEPDQSDDEQDPINVTPSKPKSKGIFDESDSDDEDLFAIESKSEKILTGSSSKTSPKAPAKSEGLFENSDDDKDLFKDASDEEDVKGEVIQPPKESSSKFKPPVGGVSMFGGGGGALQEALNKVSKRRQSSSTEAEVDNSAPRSQISNNSEKPNKSKHSNNVSTGEKSNRQKSMFSASSDDEKLFSEKSHDKKTQRSATGNSYSDIASSKAINKKKDLFDISDSGDDDDDLFGKVASKPVVRAKESKSNSIKSTDSKSSMPSKNSRSSEKAATVKESNHPTRVSSSAKTESESSREFDESKKRDKINSKSNLFGDFESDDDEKDLFASTSKSSAKSNLKSNRLQSSDDDSGLFDSKPPSLPKSGGSSSTASRTSSKASLPAPSKVSSNSLQSKGKSSQRGLFDDDSDDEALKGGTISKPRKSVPIAKSKPATSKKKGLFDDSGSDEDLFSGMKSSTTRSSKPSVQNSKPEKKEDSLQKKKETTKEVDVVTSKPTVATKPKKDLFDTESEDEHLFSSSSKNTSKDAPLFDGDENDGGLERDDQSVKEEEEVPKRKKLAGAVSMFGAGGGELLAAVSKRRSTSQISNTSNKGDKVSEGTSNSNKQHTTDTEVSAGSKDALFDDKSPSSTAPVITNVVAKPFSLTSTSKSQPVLTKVTAPTSKSNIGKLQANLAINPSALLPGAAPKIVSSVDVDAPLETATKTRSRGQAGRRPPSRHARRKVAQNAAGDVFTSVSSDIATTSPPSENLIKSPVNPKVESIPGEEKAAAKHDDNLDDWLAAPKDKPAKNIKTVAPKKKTQLPDIFGDDEDDFLKVSKPSSKTKKESLFDDDLLFGSVVKPIASDTSKPPSKPDDDFFKTELDFKSDTTSSLFDESKTSSSKKKKHNLFADDLFADLDSDLTSKSKKSGDSKKTNNIKFDDDEDIFGDIGSEATKEKQKKVAEKPKATSKLEEIDGDDLFGDVSPVVSTKKKETKPANAPKLDLFDDDADIFGDLTAPKTKSKKKATKKAAEDSSIFDDDDIFSSTTATKTPSTKKSKKTKSAKSKATTKAEDDIFEDPLSALLGP